MASCEAHLSPFYAEVNCTFLTKKKIVFPVQSGSLQRVCDLFSSDSGIMVNTIKSQFLTGAMLPDWIQPLRVSDPWATNNLIEAQMGVKRVKSSQCIAAQNHCPRFQGSPESIRHHHRLPTRSPNHLTYAETARSLLDGLNCTLFSFFLECKKKQ